AWQPEHGGQLPYGSGPLCTPVQLGTSGDLDVWLLLAAAEDGLGSRDTAFFRQQVPWLDGRRRVSVGDHVERSFEHEESLRGPHGGYLAGTNGDWSDFSTQFLGMTESMLVTAQLAYVYPYLGELASRLGDRPFAAELRRRGAELRRVLHAQWTGRGWYSRGYGGGRPRASGATVVRGIPLSEAARSSGSRSRGRSCRARRAGTGRFDWSRTSGGSSTASEPRPRCTDRRGSGRRSARRATTRMWRDGPRLREGAATTKRTTAAECGSTVTG